MSGWGDTCPTCAGQGCEYGCGNCEMSPSMAGPDAHKVCRECGGFGGGNVNDPEHDWRDIVCDWAAVARAGVTNRDHIDEDLGVALSKAGWCIVRQSDEIRIPKNPEQRAELFALADLTPEEREAFEEWIRGVEAQRRRAWEQSANEVLP